MPAGTENSPLAFPYPTAADVPLNRNGTLSMQTSTVAESGEPWMKRSKACPLLPVWMVPALPPALLGGPAKGNDVPLPPAQADTAMANAPKTARRAKRLG